MQATMRRSGLGIWLILLLAVAIVPLMRATVMAPILHEHAVRKHGVDASSVRSCVSTPGNIMQIWSKNNSERYHIITMLQDGRFGDMIVQFDGHCFHEITSFPRYEENLDDLEEALRKEAKQVWDFRPEVNIWLRWLRGVASLLGMG